MHTHNHWCGPGAYGFGGRHRSHRGGFGPFGGGGPGGSQRGGFPLGRMIRDGDLRLMALALIEETPRHGYDIIKALEERSSGFYSPSPGVIYPTLTFLDEAGFAISNAEGNKKVYTITDTGKAHLDENRDHVEAIFRQMEFFGQKMEKAREWFDWAGGAWEDRPSESKSEAAQSLEQARRRLRALIVAATEGTDGDMQRVADLLNRASDEILGKGGDH